MSYIQEVMSAGIPGQAAKAIASDKTYNVNLGSSVGWVNSVIAGGTSSIDTATKSAIYTCLANGDAGYSRIPIRDLFADSIDSTSVEVVARFSITNGTAGTRAIVALRSSTTSDVFTMNCWGSGKFERGAELSGSWSSGGYTADSVVPVNGTGWMRLRVRGSTLESAYGTGTTTAQPTRWKVMTNVDYTLSNDGVPTFDTFELAGGQYDVPSSTVVVRIFDVTIRKL